MINLYGYNCYLNGKQFARSREPWGSKMVRRRNPYTLEMPTTTTSITPQIYLRYFFIFDGYLRSCNHYTRNQVVLYVSGALVNRMMVRWARKIARD